MAAGVIAAGIAAAGAIAGGIINARANRKATERQNEYNTPKNQMLRYQEAGLNPHLIYGQGSPGNQPQATPQADWQKVTGESIQLYNQTRLADAQVSAIDANVVKTQAQAALAQVQAQVLAKNPLLNPAAYNSIIDSLKATAEQKSADAAISQRQSNWFNQRTKSMSDGIYTNQFNGNKKMDAELALLEQRFNLGQSDQQIKNQILTSKEFQNAILEVQKKFMLDADITPQHILEFTKLLIMKIGQ